MNETIFIIVSVVAYLVCACTISLEMSKKMKKGDDSSKKVACVAALSLLPVINIFVAILCIVWLIAEYEPFDFGGE